MGSDQPSGRLISWKQIAHYLQCEERTAQRWEQERALPVHRVPGDKRGTVYCFKHEIDEWLQHQPDNAPLNVEIASARSDSPSARDTADPILSKLPQMNLKRWLVFTLVVAAAFWLGKTTQYARTVKDLVPAKYQYAGADLVIQNRLGEILWSHRFERGLRIPDEEADPWPRIHFEDMDGDGTTEVIAAVGFLDSFPREPNHQQEIYCFTSTGQIRWRYQFMDSLSFGGTEYRSPYSLRNALITGTGRKHLWVVYVHQPWWPAVLLKLDSDGREVGRFVNAGYIYALDEVRNSKGAFIVAGGVNNEYNAGMVAVLDAENPNGRSPQTVKSQYDCKGCPDGRPLRYFIFPRSELNRSTASPYNAVYHLRLLENRLDAITLETQADPSQRSESHYEFDLDFRLISAHRGDAYWNVHRVLEPRVIPHSADKCPERFRPIFVREWQDRIWREVYPADVVSQAKR